MALFEWSEKYSVGIREIDDQHKKLIGLVARLQDAMREGKGKAVLDKVLAELIQYTRTHFAAEERIMQTNGYPDFEGAGLVRQKVDIAQKGNHTTDFTDADAAAPFGRKLDTSTWHHHENMTTMQEIDRMIHRRFKHRGGVSVKKAGQQ